MSVDGGGSLLITNARLCCPDFVEAPGWLLVKGRRIAGIGYGQPPAIGNGQGRQLPQQHRHIDGSGLHVLPGFIDLHVHGAVGHEVMDASADGLRAMARFYAAHGVTAFLPTTWTAAPKDIARALDTVAAVAGPVDGGASILGAHLEGPYLNPDRCGAQDPRHIRRADREEATALLDRDIIRLVALAPEFPENLWLVEECVRRGVTASIAHSAADYAQTLAAAAHGARQATHTFNAMTGLGHREPGTVGAVLTLPQLRCELIADTIHVHPAAIEVLLAAKGLSGVILITDAIRAAGMPDGAYAIDSRTVTVRDGAVRLADGTLAGSILTMDAALRTMAAVTGRPLRDLWPLSSLNAARAIGQSATTGSLEVGKDADLVLLDDRLEVRLTVAQGHIVFGEPRNRPAVTPG